MINGLGAYQNTGLQASFFKSMIELSGSEFLKQMAKSGQMSDAELVQYILTHPEELSGVQGQNGQMASLLPPNPAANQAQKTAAPTAAAPTAAPAAAETAAAPTAAAPADTYAASGDLGDDEADPDLKEFDENETMAAPTGCSMGDVSAADKAKPEMQQNLREVKAVKTALNDMAKDDSENTELPGAVSQLQQKETIIRSLLKRGKKAADANYRAQGVDPMDMNSVASFSSKIGKEVLELGAKNGLDIQVSSKRAERLNGGGLENPQAQKGQAAKGQNAVKKDDQGPKGAGGGQAGGNDDVMEIKTAKTEKSKEMDVDEVEQNPAMRDAIVEQLQGLMAQKAQAGANFTPPGDIDLGVTKAGSPIDNAFSGGPKGAAQGPGGGDAVGLGGGPGATEKGSSGPSVFGAAPTQGASVFAAPAQGAAHAATAAPKGLGSTTGTSTGDIRGMLEALGMQGKKFNAKVMVHEPGAAVQLGNKDAGGQGGISVNGGLSGKAIAVKKPALVAKDEDGKMYAVANLHRASDGGFTAKIKGEATGNEAASKSIMTSGNGSIAIPGTKAS